MTSSNTGMQNVKDPGWGSPARVKHGKHGKHGIFGKGENDIDIPQGHVV